jgi:single-strand DNA-binding protein
MNGIEAAFEGRLGSDPESRVTSAGKPWVRFSVAVGEGDGVQWISVSCFADHVRAEAEGLAKGDRCYIEGWLKLNAWKDRTGQERAGLSVVATKARAVGGASVSAPKPSAKTKVSAATR